MVVDAILFGAAGGAGGVGDAEAEEGGVGGEEFVEECGFPGTRRAGEDDGTGGGWVDLCGWWHGG